MNQTPNFGFYVPADNDTGWGAEINTNFSSIDTLLAARIPNPSNAAVGDLLMWLSTGWSRLAAPPLSNYVLCGNGVGAALSFKAFASSMMTVDANIPMAGKKLTGLAAGTASGDSVRYDEFAAASLKSGMILIWSGSIATIPAGYVICNGSNSTPDLRDKFVVGAGSTYAVGATGGEATHTLTIAEMPTHTHPVGACAPGSDGYNSFRAVANSAATTIPTVTTGGGGSHNTLPPYYALAYVMKT